MNYKYMVVLVLWMVLIFYLSSIPHLAFGLEEHQEQFFRKSIHILLYGILTFLMWFSFPKLDESLFTKVRRFRRFTQNKGQKIIVCGILATLYAVSDEIHQAFVPGRCGNVKGVLFDLIGIGAVLIWLGMRVRSRGRRTEVGGQRIEL